mgnify:CR=1 FL=1
MAKKMPHLKEVGLAICDPCVPLSKLSEAFKKIREIFDKYGIIAGLMGHAGLGLLHPVIYVKVDDEEYWRKVKKAEKEIAEYVLSVGGSISGEHGVGIVKIPYAVKSLGSSLDLMRKIKEAFDSEWIMNPGKMGLDYEERDYAIEYAYPKYWPDER